MSYNLSFSSPKGRRRRSMTDEGRITIQWRPRSTEAPLHYWTGLETLKENQDEVDLKDLAAQRGKIIDEILQVERAYVDNLTAIVNYYYLPLLGTPALTSPTTKTATTPTTSPTTSRSKNGGSGIGADLMDQQAITLIFGQFENFLGNHKRLLKVLEGRTQEKEWSLFESPFADIFLTETEFVSSYKSYFKLYSYYLTAIDKNIKASPSFAAFLEECKQKSLMKKLLSVTWPEHPDHIPTRQAQQMMKALAVSLDSSNDIAKDCIKNNKKKEKKIEKSLQALRKQKKPSVNRKEQLKLTLSVKPGDIDVLQRIPEAEGEYGGVEVYSCHIGGWLCAMKQVVLDSPESSPKGSLKAIDKEMKILEAMPFHQNIMRYLFHDNVDGHLRIFTTRYDCTLGHILELRRQKGDACRGGALLSPGGSTTPFLITEIVQFALEVVRGLIFLHENQIIHRDIRSANVWGFKHDLESGPGLAKLAIGNFDCSKKITKSSRACTVIGTVGFMAPEVLASNEKDTHYSAEADIYGFGMLLYEMITLRQPYEGLSNSEIREKVLEGERPPIPRGDMIPLVSLFEECTQREPGKRIPLAKVKTALVEMV